ncbi:portal vertex protein [Aeromonas phage Asfd_1]|nr:portal vertex protein [Aeromonas phage Asfd_1]
MRFLDIFKFWDREDDHEYEERLKMGHESIAAPIKDDGATEIESREGESSYNAVMQQFFSVDNNSISGTKDLINTYRSLVNNPEVERAVSNIVNEAIVYEKGHKVVALDLDDTDFSAGVKEKILEEFDEVCSLLNASRDLETLFRRWYVDSRIYFHKVMKDPKKGLVELRRLDPRHVEYYREIVTNDIGGTKVVKGYREFFIYTTGTDGYAYNGRIFEPNTRIKIPRSAVVYANSGLQECSGRGLIGYLHNAVKPANQLKMLEDALVIYRITRAPERRVFYIDVGDMNNRRGAEYMNSIMQSLKNRVVYDAQTGTVKNQKRNIAMTEDYWLMRKNGKAVTEVSSMPGAQTMGDMDDVRWFNRKLYEALRIPISRIPRDDGGMVIGGQDTTITRDELDFRKFVVQLQHQFEEIFLDPLKTNLVYKRIITEQEWDEQLNNIKVNFHQDSYYTELKDIETLRMRVDALSQIEPYVGKYVSHDYVMKNILQMTDEQIAQEAEQIEKEADEKRFQNPENEDDF